MGHIAQKHVFHLHMIFLTIIVVVVVNELSLCRAHGVSGILPAATSLRSWIVAGLKVLHE